MNENKRLITTRIDPNLLQQINWYQDRMAYPPNRTQIIEEGIELWLARNSQALIHKAFAQATKKSRATHEKDTFVKRGDVWMTKFGKVFILQNDVLNLNHHASAVGLRVLENTSAHPILAVDLVHGYVCADQTLTLSVPGDLIEKIGVEDPKSVEEVCWRVRKILDL